VELRHLKSFLAVADALSFIRAAKALHLSQPALTSQIQKLEEEVGVQLLLRNKRSVRLTDAGTIFVEEARETLARAAKALERVQRASRGEIGLLRIGFVSSAALEIVPFIATAFRKRYPQVQLDLMNVRSSAQLEQLSSRTLDIGFVRLPASHSGLEFLPVHSEPFVIVLSKDHPLAAKGSLSLRDLSNEHFVAYGRRWAPGFFDQIVAICNKAGFTPNIVQETAEMYTAIALVAAGREVAILPRSLVFAQGRGVVSKSIPATVMKSEIAIVTRAGEQSPLVANFVTMARRARKIE
jgi:DNA-binding transcriptional LysR family regulator